MVLLVAAQAPKISNTWQSGKTMRKQPPNQRSSSNSSGNGCQNVYAHNEQAACARGKRIARIGEWMPSLSHCPLKRFVMEQYAMKSVGCQAQAQAQAQTSLGAYKMQLQLEIQRNYGRELCVWKRKFWQLQIANDINAYTHTHTNTHTHTCKTNK